MSGCSGKVGGGNAGDPKPDDTAHADTDVVAGPQRSAASYAEVVVIEPHDAYAETCTGVLIAPRVVLTAAHCVVYVPASSWTVTAPFAGGGAETHTARGGEPMDAAFRNVSKADYPTREMRDVGVLYLDVPFANVKYAIMSGAGYVVEKSAAPVFVSSVGRSTSGLEGGLALSAITSLDSPATASLAHIDYATARVTAAGESGGPLFTEGTHKLVAVHASVDAAGKTDAWARLDGDVYTWITQKVAAHGGWIVETPP